MADHVVIIANDIFVRMAVTVSPYLKERLSTRSANS